MGSNVDVRLKKFRQHILSHHLSHQTARTYCIHLSKFFRFIDKRRVTKPNRPQVDAFRVSLLKLSPAARRQADAALRCYFKLLVADGLLLNNPMDGVKSARTKPLAKKATLTPEQMERLLAAPALDTPLGVRNRAILELLYSSAIRKSELLNLTVYDLELREGFLWVRKGKGGKDRKVPLGKSASQWVRRYLDWARPQLGREQATPRLFLSRVGNTLEDKDLRLLIRACAAKAGIKKRVTPHMFRHTAATEMVRNGAPLRYVQEMLGHSHMATTQVYTRVANPDLERMIAECHPSSKSKAKAPKYSAGKDCEKRYL